MLEDELVRTLWLFVKVSFRLTEATRRQVLYAIMETFGLVKVLRGCPGGATAWGDRRSTGEELGPLKKERTALRRAVGTTVRIVRKELLDQERQVRAIAAWDHNKDATADPSRWGTLDFMNKLALAFWLLSERDRIALGLLSLPVSRKWIARSLNVERETLDVIKWRAKNRLRETLRDLDELADRKHRPPFPQILWDAVTEVKTATVGEQVILLTQLRWLHELLNAPDGQGIACCPESAPEEENEHV